MIEIIDNGNYDSSGLNKFVKIRTDEIVHGAINEGEIVEFWSVSDEHSELWNLSLQNLLQSFINEEGLKSMIGLRRVHGELHEDSGAGAYGGITKNLNNDVITNNTSINKLVLGLILYLGFSL